MKTIAAYYRQWSILAVPLGAEWTNRCVPPSKNTVCTDWELYDTPEAALAGAQEYVDRTTAIYALAEVLLELYEEDKIDPNDCHELLQSLGYC